MLIIGPVALFFALFLSIHWLKIMGSGSRYQQVFSCKEYNITTKLGLWQCWYLEVVVGNHTLRRENTNRFPSKWINSFYRHIQDLGSIYSPTLQCWNLVGVGRYVYFYLNDWCLRLWGKVYPPYIILNEMELLTYDAQRYKYFVNLYTCNCKIISYIFAFKFVEVLISFDYLL